MTDVATLADRRPVPREPHRHGSALRLASGRLLRLELRRSPMLLMIPVGVFLFWFDTYRSSMMLDPTWGSQTLLLRQGSALEDFAPFVAGFAAWTGARDGRRRTAEQIGVTALPRWAARLSSWAAATFWVVLAHGFCLAALYMSIDSHVTGGSAPWWPVIVDLTGLIAMSAIGFALGVMLPSRFTAPLVAIVVFMILTVTRTAPGKYAMLSPAVSPMYSLSPAKADAGVFYPYGSDLPKVQVFFWVGLAVLALGTLGVSAVCGGRLARLGAAVTAAAGVALAATAVGLVGTATVVDGRVTIAAVHDSSQDVPISYTPSCSGSAAIPVCVNPAYQDYLPSIAAGLAPLLDAVAGLPGAPVRANQVPSVTDSLPVVASVTGSPATLDLSLSVGDQGLMWISPSGPPSSVTMPCCSSRTLWSSSELIGLEIKPLVGVAVVKSMVGLSDDAQQAVSLGLLESGGVPASEFVSRDGQFPDANVQILEKVLPGTPTYEAAQRFAAMSAQARHAWLVAHLDLLRAGRLTLADLP